MKILSQTGRTSHLHVIVSQEHEQQQVGTSGPDLHIYTTSCYSVFLVVTGGTKNTPQYFISNESILKAMRFA